MAINPATSVLKDNYDGLFLSGFTAPLPNLWYKDITKEFVSDGLIDIMPGVKSITKMHAFGYGNCRSDNLPTPFRYSVVKTPWANEATLNRDQYENDTLGAFDGMVEGLGKDALRDPNRKVLNLITGNGNAYDGAAFYGTHTIGIDTTGLPMFVTANGVVTPNGAAGTAVTYTNVVDLNLIPALKVAATTNIPTNVEAANIVAELIGYFLTLPDWAGDQINSDMQGLELLVGDALSFAAFNMASAAVAYVAPGISNPVLGLVQGGFKITVKLVPGLGTGVVYAFRSDAEIPAFVKTESPSGIRTFFQGVGSDYQQTCDNVRYNAQVDRGYGYGLPTSAVKATISH